jgi:hypothetical protein
VVATAVEIPAVAAVTAGSESPVLADQSLIAQTDLPCGRDQVAMHCHPVTASGQERAHFTVWLDRAVERCERSLDQLDMVAADIDRRLR